MRTQIARREGPQLLFLKNRYCPLQFGRSTLAACSFRPVLGRATVGFHPHAERNWRQSVAARTRRKGHVWRGAADVVHPQKEEDQDGRGLVFVVAAACAELLGSISGPHAFEVMGPPP